jgi:CheY-like chemotaxis protein
MTPQVLITDDEPFMLHLIEASLKKGGLSVASCRSGEQALESAARLAPQLIIMDMTMPGLDGLATLRRMKQMEALRDVPVIMLTSRGHQLARVEALESGAQLFLTKPFSPSRLLEESIRLLAVRTGAL